MTSDRDRTMAVRALRRLSRTELAGLGIGLDALVECRDELVASLPLMRRAAEREASLRLARKLKGLGSFGQAERAARYLLARVELAIEDTTQAVEVGKVERRT